MSKEKKMSFDTIITMAGKEVAVGKELKYFWNNKNKIVTKHRINIIRTLIELHKKKRLTDKVVTAEGDYQVKEYTIPNIPWVKEFVCFSHRIYVTSVASIDENYIEFTLRDAFAEETNTLPDLNDDEYKKLVQGANLGTVLSPDAFKTALKQITQYNEEWKATAEIAKNAILINDLHGFFTTDGKYYVINREADRTYTQMLGITFDGFKAWGSTMDALDNDALINALTAKKSAAAEKTNGTDKE